VTTHIVHLVVTLNGRRLAINRLQGYLAFGAFYFLDEESIELVKKVRSQLEISKPVNFVESIRKEISACV